MASTTLFENSGVKVKNESCDQLIGLAARSAVTSSKKRRLVPFPISRRQTTTPLEVRKLSSVSIFSSNPRRRDARGHATSSGFDIFNLERIKFGPKLSDKSILLYPLIHRSLPFFSSVRARLQFHHFLAQQFASFLSIPELVLARNQDRVHIEMCAIIGRGSLRPMSVRGLLKPGASRCGEYKTNGNAPRRHTKKGQRCRHRKILEAFAKVIVDTGQRDY